MKGFILGVILGAFTAFLVWKVENVEKRALIRSKVAKMEKIEALNRYIEILENEIN